MATLFVSDLHLDAGAPAISERFLAFLAGPARAAEALYILGDLFETWIGDDDDDPHRAQLCAALGRLADQGVACHVMHGNRDFLLGRGFEARTGATLIADPLIVEAYGQALLLTHGDALCTADHAYQRLRRLVRDPHWQRRFLALPLRVRRALAEQARSGSRRHTGAAADAIMDADIEAVRATMTACGVRELVHGHTHRPGMHTFELEGAPARRTVLGAWHDQPNCLHWDGSGLRLQALD